MSEKISQYTADATSNPIKVEDLMDFSNEDGGGGFDVSKKITVAEMLAFINTNGVNYYSSDGAITETRTVEQNGFASVFENGTLINKANLNDVGYLLQDSLGVEKGSFGYDVGLDSATLELKNAAGTYLSVVDGFIGLSESTPAAKLHIKETNFVGGLRVDSATEKLFEVNGNTDSVTVGNIGAGLAKFHIKASGSVGGTTAMLVENDVNDVILDIKDDSIITTNTYGFGGLQNNLFADATNQTLWDVNADAGGMANIVALRIDLSNTSGYSAGLRIAGALEAINTTDGDVRLQGASDSNLFLLDNSTDRIGVGISPLAAKLHLLSTGQTRGLRIDRTGLNNQFYTLDAGGIIMNDNVGIGGVATATSILNITGLPTSSAGLATGDVWNNSGVLTIV